MSRQMNTSVEMAVNTKMCRYALDGLLTHENEELRDRVTSLEKRLELQEDEILCLKSALSDAIRRIASLENNKGNVCKCSHKHNFSGMHHQRPQQLRCRSPSPQRITSKPLRVTSPKTGKVFCAWGPPPSYNRARPVDRRHGSPVRWRSADRLYCTSSNRSLDNLTRISPITIQPFCTTRINGSLYDSPGEHRVQFANGKGRPPSGVRGTGGRGVSTPGAQVGKGTPAPGYGSDVDAPLMRSQSATVESTPFDFSQSPYTQKGAPNNGPKGPYAYNGRGAPDGGAPYGTDENYNKGLDALSDIMYTNKADDNSELEDIEEETMSAVENEPEESSPFTFDSITPEINTKDESVLPVVPSSPDIGSVFRSRSNIVKSTWGQRARQLSEEKNAPSSDRAGDNRRTPSNERLDERYPNDTNSNKPDVVMQSESMASTPEPSCFVGLFGRGRGGRDNNANEVQDMKIDLPKEDDDTGMLNKSDPHGRGIYLPVNKSPEPKSPGHDSSVQGDRGLSPSRMPVDNNGRPKVGFDRVALRRRSSQPVAKEAVNEDQVRPESTVADKAGPPGSGDVFKPDQNNLTPWRRRSRAGEKELPETGDGRAPQERGYEPTTMTGSSPSQSIPENAGQRMMSPERSGFQYPQDHGRNAAPRHASQSPHDSGRGDGQRQPSRSPERMAPSQPSWRSPERSPASESQTSPVRAPTARQPSKSPGRLNRRWPPSDSPERNEAPVGSSNDSGRGDPNRRPSENDQRPSEQDRRPSWRRPSGSPSSELPIRAEPETRGQQAAPAHAAPRGTSQERRDPEFSRPEISPSQPLPESGMQRVASPERSSMRAPSQSPARDYGRRMPSKSPDQPGDERGRGSGPEQSSAEPTWRSPERRLGPSGTLPDSKIGPSNALPDSKIGRVVSPQRGPETRYPAEESYSQPERGPGRMTSPERYPSRGPRSSRSPERRHPPNQQEEAMRPTRTEPARSAPVAEEPRRPSRTESARSAPTPLADGPEQFGGDKGPYGYASEEPSRTPRSGQPYVALPVSEDIVQPRRNEPDRYAPPTNDDLDSRMPRRNEPRRSGPVEEDMVAPVRNEPVKSSPQADLIAPVYDKRQPKTAPHFEEPMEPVSQPQDHNAPDSRPLRRPSKEQLNGPTRRPSGGHTERSDTPLEAPGREQLGPPDALKPRTSRDNIPPFEPRRSRDDIKPMQPRKSMDNVLPSTVIATPRRYEPTPDYDSDSENQGPRNDRPYEEEMVAPVKQPDNYYQPYETPPVGPSLDDYDVIPTPTKKKSFMDDPLVEEEMMGKAENKPDHTAPMILPTYNDPPRKKSYIDDVPVVDEEMVQPQENKPDRTAPVMIMPMYDEPPRKKSYIDDETVVEEEMAKPEENRPDQTAPLAVLAPVINERQLDDEPLVEEDAVLPEQLQKDEQTPKEEQEAPEENKENEEPVGGAATPSKTPTKTTPKSAVGRPSGGAPHAARRSTETRSSPAGKASPKTLSVSSKRASHNASPSPYENANGTAPSSREPQLNKDDGTIKMYLRGRPVTLYMPTDAAQTDLSKIGDPPSSRLKLEWCYGYRGRDCRNNVYFLPTGEIIYFVAAVVVLYSVEEQMQRHYLGHNDDVKCLAVHPDRITIASGQVAGHDKSGGKPHVRVWNSVSLATLHIIGLGDFERAVCCVSFSKADQGHFLCVVDEGNDHTLSVWEWSTGDKGRKVTECKSSTEAVLGAEFHPLDKNCLVSYGKSQVSFWSLDNGTLNKKAGIFDKHEKPKFILCMTFAENGDVITGDSNGSIFVWARGGNKISRAVVGAHEGAIFTLCMLKDGFMLSGGGRDRKIIQWDADLNKTGSETELSEHYGAVRTLSQGRGNMILTGTTKNALLQGTLSLEFSPIVQGHTDEVWGLAMHPGQHQFLTCAYDRQIFLWDALTHTVIWQKEINDTAHCACFYPEGGDIVAIGSAGGRWFVLDTTSHDIIAVHTDGGEQIECIQFSPDGQYLALGSRDNSVYVYSTTEGGRKYSRVGRCTGHSSFITHLDWSEDSAYIMTNSGDYEVLFWTAHNCMAITSASSMRDVRWKTQSCTLSINSCGIWPEGADGTDINACAKSTSRTGLLASADDFGKVNLYKFPAMKPLSGAHCYGGHSSHVTNVTFLYDDSRLLSTGGKDTAVMQWEII